MDLSSIIPQDGIIPSLAVSSKKEAFQQLAHHASVMTGLSQPDVYHALIQRERLGSTGIGRGIGIPHVKFSQLNSILCLFFRLHKPIPFESQDGEDVDIIFLLLAPEHASGDHLKMLARISRLVREPLIVDQLRSAQNVEDIKLVLYRPAAPHAA